MKYTPETTRKFLENSSNLDWYHKFEVESGSEVYTPGRLDVKGYQWRRDYVGLDPKFVAGKRVLDVGAYSGAFSFLMQDLGAEVVAVDVYDPDFNGFNLVRDLRGRDIEHYHMSVYDLDPKQIGTFDIVAFYGVHYHLKHPLLAYERCNSVCKPGGLFIGGGTGLDHWYHDNDPSCANGVSLQALESSTVSNERVMSVDSINDLSLCGFVADQYFLDKTNWFIPNLTCIQGWVEASGFELVKAHKTGLPIDREWNREKQIKRTTLNFVAQKTSEPTPEYTWKRMKGFTIPTQFEMELLKQEIAILKSKFETQ